ncbi:probable starch synthase 4, chloroplastic/amyloplastic isoform X2 [Ricinus communis]|uniref:probable starch synthase 4, chloroplastic/amyloplastic isoform X2 n=1 Tax=Ricinus communis TaxID=3988 RepID=UPI00201AADBC|nr:probable starch synthase 4, chloroplastic/amyloplastic isoform X2 [Ricinus communis]
MATKPASWFLSQGYTVFNCNHNNHYHHNHNKQTNVRFFLPPHRLLPTSCKMRQRNLSSQNKRQQVKKASPEIPPTGGDFESSSGDDIDDSEVALSSLDVKSVHYTSAKDEKSNTNAEHAQLGDAKDLDNLTQEMKSLGIYGGEELSSIPDEIKSSGLKIDGGEQLSRVQLEDLIGMIRNAEKNILLLNQARVNALEDLQRILAEKEILQGEINILEMRLAETDARMKVAAQEKIHVDLMEDQLEKLRNELAYRSENQSRLLNEDVPLLQDTTLHSLSEELNSLREENTSLKNDIEALKLELSNVKDTDERVMARENERMLLESSLKDLESKLLASQEDVSKLSILKVECKDLWEKVETLQALLDKATKQADQAILVLQQNQELRKKVDKLEESLEEANAYKLSSEKLQQYNEFMQQKMKLLEERLQRSDEEINSYVSLYQESVQEFQDMLNIVKEESKKKALDEPVNDMPWEFWSHLLLMIDGWLLEKKISADDAKMLRDMVQKRDRRIHDTYFECRQKNENEAISMFLKLTSSPSSPGLHVIHIAAEMAPVAKVGGLGDVVAGLGKALQKRGHLVEIILPKYDCMQYNGIGNLRALDVTVESYFDGKLYKNKIWVGTIEGLPVYFIEPHHPDKFFWRGQFYGEHDDFKRFSFFSRAALELLHQSGKKPDIIHSHDWQTAFVAPLYWDLYAPKGLNSARICFTCHNFEYQGTAPASELASCGLDVHHLNRPDRMQDNLAHDRINPVKGAVVFSNIVTTVSPTYAQEVRTAEGGRGLHSTLNFHAKKFIGILNGIDTDSWNPATDTCLKVQYSANDLQAKAENKLATRRLLGLSTADARQPLVGCITRLVPQKGVHLIRHAIYRTVELGGQFILLGSSPVAHIQREFEGIANHFQNHEHVRLILKYDDSLAHSIYAASDMFIIPSIFEPCGLTQMIAMRYGSIPIARKTGGLNDSVFDVDDVTIPLQFQNGFTFLNPDEQGISGALERAFNYYRNNPEGWQKLVQKDMNIDFSWESSAAQYEELYSKSVARAKAAVNRT